uniref:leucine-rich repeat flightless-interacting protein 2-like isoform X4 n=1 Tax=Solea senegalensis TaxID=28829 RepID=UPI001CD8D131|nr:leucine-rich repeat flightless-interacting protein 2-like isoform X4 [Solea senegalensis]
MSAQGPGPGRNRIPNRDKLSAEDEALNQIIREAEARLAAKRAARAEAREIRMKELERREKERYYGLDNKWGHIEQWMEDSERYSRPSRRLTSVSDDEEKMSVGSRGSFRPSDYSSFLSSSSRTSSRASSARASPVVEDRSDRDFLDKGSRTASTLSTATLASLGGASSRRGSCDTSFSVETEASIREIKDSLVEAEEKYRRAMVSNVQLHSEKTALMYQVDTLRAELNDMEEMLWEARRQCDVTAKEFERERQNHTVTQFTLKHMRDAEREREELLTEVCELRGRSTTHRQEVSDLQEALQWKEKRIMALERHKDLCDVTGLKKEGVVSPDAAPNGELEKCTDQEACPGVRESMLELQLKKLVDERLNLQDEVRHLRTQLNTDAVQQPQGGDVVDLDLQRDTNRLISELKFRLVRCEQEVTVLQHNVIRLEGQVTRYKSASEKSEMLEDELKVENRKLQRELRAALDRVDELDASNSHLIKRLEKMKSNRSALLAQQ